MKTFRSIAGYVLGGVMFVVLLPTIMWLASGMPALEHIGALRASITGLLILSGLTLSIWTIVYMKRQGKGNPMDAFDHEIGPRTQHLMTDGPYRLNRNPMLTGTFIYLLGYIVWLWTWQALLVWVIFVAIMLVQVVTEEKRLRRDFGEEYEAYCQRTGRFFPITCHHGRTKKEGEVEDRDTMDFEAIEKEVDARAEEQMRKELGLRRGQRMMGSCHLFWAIKKQILWEEYGIHWLSPQDLNPGTRYD